MLKFYWLLKGKLSDWLFRRAYKRAPIQILGHCHVKDVYNKLYVVDVNCDCKDCINGGVTR